MIEKTCAGKKKTHGKEKTAHTGNRDKSRNKIRLLTVVLAAAVLLAVLYAAAEWGLPALSGALNRRDTAEIPSGGTRLFYEEEQFSDADAREYEQQIRDIYYKNKDGVETLITHENYRQTGDSAAVLFGDYIDAVKNGDSGAYAACFSERYDFENGMDRFASGEESFPPQRLYDIHIEQLDSLYDEATGITAGLFDVRYRIYKNTGDFRNDITDDMAPLLFVTEEIHGETKITDIRYRYGGGN